MGSWIFDIPQTTPYSMKCMRGPWGSVQCSASQGREGPVRTQSMEDKMFSSDAAGIATPVCGVREHVAVSQVSIQFPGGSE